MRFHSSVAFGLLTLSFGTSCSIDAVKNDALGDRKSELHMCSSSAECGPASRCLHGRCARYAVRHGKHLKRRPPRIARTHLLDSGAALPPAPPADAGLPDRSPDFAVDCDAGLPGDTAVHVDAGTPAPSDVGVGPIHESDAGAVLVSTSPPSFDISPSIVGLPWQTVVTEDWTVSQIRAGVFWAQASQTGGQGELAMGAPWTSSGAVYGQGAGLRFQVQRGSYSLGDFLGVRTEVHGESGFLLGRITAMPDSLVPRTCDIGDLDQDGYIDSIVVDQEAGQLWVLRNDRVGNFGIPEVALDEGVVFARVGDVDGDGNADVVSLGRDLVVMRHAASGLVEASRTDAGASFPLLVPDHFTLIDFDLDFDLDVAVAMRDTDGGHTIVLFRNDGAGNFSSAAETVLLPYSPLAAGLMDARDVTGDYRPELFIPRPNNDMITILRSEGGTLVYERDVPTAPISPSTVSVRALNADGTFDVAAVGPGGWSDLFDGGLSGVSASTNWTGLEPSAGTLTADMDADGDADLLYSDPTLGNLKIALNDGRGRFDLATEVLLDYGPEHKGYGPICSADLDRNGSLDLIVLRGGLGIRSAVWTMHNRLSISATATLLPPSE